MSSRKLGVAGLLAILTLGACSGEEPAPSSSRPAESVPEAADYVTSAACHGCHTAAFEAWSGSHHDRAMEPATQESVLGDFSGIRFEHAGDVWEFFRRDGAFYVRTQGPDAVPAEFEVLYSFGFEPLQQYLVALSEGRMQALTVAWDSRPTQEGGQRWFSLQPDERPPPGDVLHWTGAGNRWNSMCADCHSTNLQKNFDLAAKRYDTTWSEIDVACEACHGPGSAHVAWAEAGADPGADPGAPHALVDFGSGGDAHWIMDATRGIARRTPARHSQVELETCAPCHSRRSPIAAGAPGPGFLDHYQPALLEEGLYFADGQIRDEVYVYGSFLQSKMHQAGVSCGDCHEPHSLALRAPGDALCAQCHAPERFAEPAHHQHPQASEGARCVACHMPARTYMQVDDRRDHSFRVPRPDLAAKLGTPEPCTGCHAQHDAGWATLQIERWADSPPSVREGYALALARARRGAPDAALMLRALARRSSEPAIVRATAVSLLSRYPGAASADAIARAASDTEPLLRLASARAAEALPPTERASRIGSLLTDPVRSVRIEAARALAPVPVAQLSSHLAAARARGVAEYRRAQAHNADVPSAHVNLGLLALAQGRPAAAERAYKEALSIGNYFVPTYVNLADLYRVQGREAEAEALLRRAEALAPESAEVQHALGLCLVRRGQTQEALASLRRASELAPDSARFAFVYGVALQSTGAPEAALAVLAAAHDRHSGDRDILEALVAMHREHGRESEARGYLEKLRALSSAAPPPEPEGR